MAFLVLEDGTVLKGGGFGAEKTVYGEVVFTTAMVGYPESLTDPSYRGQILVETNPLVGNYGVPDPGLMDNGLPLHYESDGIKVEGFVISRVMRPSHWTSVKSLEKWMEEEGVPGIQGVDTRALVKRLRERGVMLGALVNDETSVEEAVEGLKKVDYGKMNFVKLVTPGEPVIHEPPRPEKTVIVVDMGVKYGILRELLKRNIKVVRIPYGTDVLEAFEEFSASGVFFSNGPGNPALLKEAVREAKRVMEAGIPTMGVCLGEQVLAMADGAEIYKMKYGHRGINKPVKDLERGRAFVTTQNHGYAIVPESLDGFEVWMVNLDDGSVEGIKHRELPVIATQHHPEASPGPYDSTWVFDEFVKLMGGV